VDRKQGSFRRYSTNIHPAGPVHGGLNQFFPVIRIRNIAGTARISAPVSCAVFRRPINTLRFAAADNQFGPGQGVHPGNLLPDPAAGSGD